MSKDTSQEVKRVDTEQPPVNSGGIDEAISVCAANTKRHQAAAARVILYGMGLPSVFSGAILYFVTRGFNLDRLVISAEATYGVVAVVVLIVGVSTALYRFHEKEAAKNEQYGLDFMRIRIAASNHSREGFHSEVRKALTDGAFSLGPDSIIPTKPQKVASPIPGHPSSDVGAALLSKLVDQVDVVFQPKSK